MLGTFVGHNRLEVHHMASHMVLVVNPARAEKLAAGARDIQRLAAVIHLGHRNMMRLDALAALELGQAPDDQLHRRDFGSHPGELALDQLMHSERFSIELGPREQKALPMAPVTDPRT